MGKGVSWGHVTGPALVLGYHFLDKVTRSYHCTALPDSGLPSLPLPPSPPSPPSFLLPFPLGPSLMEGRVADPSLLAAALARMPRLFLPGLSGIYQIHPRNLCPKSMLAILEMARRGDGETDKMNEGTHIHTQTTLALSLPQTDRGRQGRTFREGSAESCNASLPSFNWGYLYIRRPINGVRKLE